MNPFILLIFFKIKKGVGYRMNQVVEGASVSSFLVGTFFIMARTGMFGERKIKFGSKIKKYEYDEGFFWDDRKIELETGEQYSFYCIRPTYFH